MIPDDPEALQVMAGEYVLGTLENADAREVERALRINPALRKAVFRWEEELHPLSALAQPADPPGDLWDRIARRLNQAPVRSSAALAIWRGVAIAASAIAAALVAYIALRPVPQPGLVALLHGPKATTPVWMATVTDTELSLRPITAVVPPAGRVFQLWVIPPGEKTPHSLGVLPAAAHQAVPLAAGATLAISVEPPGGSPTGLPTGPVVFLGAVQPS